MPWIDAREAATSIIVYGEIYEYFLGRPDFAERDRNLRGVLQIITPLFLSYATLRLYAIIRRQLRPPFGPGLIGDADIMIAATALERDLTVVTTDSDYTRVPGLKVILLNRRTYGRSKDT